MGANDGASFAGLRTERTVTHKALRAVPAMLSAMVISPVGVAPGVLAKAGSSRGKQTGFL